MGRHRIDRESPKLRHLHPEFKSKVLEPHPLFKAFIGAAYCYRRQRVAPLARQVEVEYSRAE